MHEPPGVILFPHGQPVAQQPKLAALILLNSDNTWSVQPQIEMSTKQLAVVLCNLAGAVAGKIEEPRIALALGPMPDSPA